MTIEELRLRCAYWQKVLRLQDWIINLSLVRQWEIPDSFGSADCHPEKRIAKVKILDMVDDGDPNDTEQYDPEVTLVHELLHVQFDAFASDDQKSPAFIASHQAIHALSHALVALDRKA